MRGKNESGVNSFELVLPKCENIKDDYFNRVVHSSTHKFTENMK